MRLPNGYGSVYRLSGKRRKPWAARKTIGWINNDEKKTSHPEYKFIGYYATRQEALAALVAYNENPYDLDAKQITFSEIYERWSEEKFKNISQSNINGYKASYALCSSLYDLPIVEIKLKHLQDVVDTSGKNYPTLRKLKVLFGQIFDYAVMHEVISKERHLVEYVNISSAPNTGKIERTVFSKTEIKKLWKESYNEYIKVILMLIYSGVRISELLDLKKEHVHIDEHYFEIISAKTQAGIRVVPIHDSTYPLFEYWMTKNSTSEYLLSTPEGHHFEYRNYYDSYWKPIMEELGMFHRPHDTRHTCTSLLTAAGVNETIIKKIVGHKGKMSLTERVYTHFEIQQLLDAINQIEK